MFGINILKYKIACLEETLKDLTQEVFILKNPAKFKCGDKCRINNPYDSRDQGMVLSEKIWKVPGMNLYSRSYNVLRQNKIVTYKEEQLHLLDNQ